MANYEFGKVYEMDVIGFRYDNADRKYILVEHEGREYQVFDIFKCQHDELPKRLFVTLKSEGIGVPVRFRQSIENFNRTHYREGELKAFAIVNKSSDWKTQQTYYEIEDEVARHRWYYTGSKVMNIGDTVNLKITGFNDKGFLKLKHAEQTQVSLGMRRVYMPESSPRSTGGPTTQNQEYVRLELGEENETLELKTTIVFHPSEPGVPNIAKQMLVIMKEIVGFMNHKGGKLYIGVRDGDCAVTGIENDYPHLSNDPSDDYTYAGNVDGFQNKIRNYFTNASAQHSTINRLTHFEFNKAGGHEYCIITVDPSERPIWLNGQRLYVRAGNSVRLITSGDEINQFVCARMLSAIQQPALDMEKIIGAIRDIINTTPVQSVDSTPRPKPPKPMEKTNDNQYWLIWHDDATCLYITENERNRWIENKKELVESENLPAIPVSEIVSKNNKALIIFCYEEGNVNIMSLKEFKSGTRSGTVIKNAYNTELKIKRIFVAEPNALLAGFSIDCHGLETVKVHNIIDLPSTQAAKNKGAMFSPSGKVYEYKLLPGSEENSVTRIKVAPAQRTSNAGVPLTSEVYQTEISFICNY